MNADHVTGGSSLAHGVACDPVLHRVLLLSPLSLEMCFISHLSSCCNHFGLEQGCEDGGKGGALIFPSKLIFAFGNKYNYHLEIVFVWYFSSSACK